MFDNTEYDLSPNTKLIFMVGAPRSGTTWLQLLLSASPLIATAVETQLFSLYARSLFSEWRWASSGRKVGIYSLMNEEEYFHFLRQFASSILARILAAKPGATMILEKTPDHALYWKDILALFPGAHFLHVIRDPRAVVASMRSASQSWADWHSPSVITSCTHWISNVAAAREIRNTTPNYLEVRYEDLKRNDTHTLRSLFAWCGVGLSDAEVASILRKNEIDRLRSFEVQELASDYGSWGKDFFRKGEIDSWRSELSWRQVVLIERLVGTLMDELGYARVTPARGGWQSAAALPAVTLGWLCNGLGWRLRNYGNTLIRWG